jgi:hypothetical protein
MIAIPLGSANNIVVILIISSFMAVAISKFSSLANRDSISLVTSLVISLAIFKHIHLRPKDAAYVRSEVITKPETMRV